MDNQKGVQISNDGSIKLTQVKAHRSIPTACLETLVKPFKPRLVKPGKPQPAGSQRLNVPGSITSGYNVNQYQIEDIWICEIAVKSTTPVENAQTHSVPRHRLLYFSGGAFQSPPSSEHWKCLASLAKELHLSCIVACVSYPLAPNSPASKSLPILYRFLETVLHQASDTDTSLTLMGDSSGGNLALCLALKAVSTPSEPVGEDNSDNTARTATSTPTPIKNVIVISPVLDLRNINPAIPSISALDPVLSQSFEDSVAQIWAADLPRDDPALSPLLADLTPLKRQGVKVHGVIGSYDVLAPDAVLFREKLEQVGIVGEWLEWEKQMHCFPLAWPYGLPEAKRGWKWVVDVMRRNV